VTNRWSAPYPLCELEDVFKLSRDDLRTLAEVGMLRGESRPGGHIFFQVYGLGNRHLTYDLMVQAEAAHRLQGSTLPADCADWQERNSALFLLMNALPDSF
jgi:hypothetical protein